MNFVDPIKNNQTARAPRIVYLTAGAAGMYCGSCMHDNALAGALQRQGVDWLLVPTYTPIRTDEEDHSVSRIAYGGINVYLEQASAWFRRLPESWTRWLDRPGVIRRLASGRIEVEASRLGELTVSVLRGEHGNQRREARKLCNWLRDELRPDLVIFSNALIAGSTPLLKQELQLPVLCVLQGDDIFLDQLPEPFRDQANTLLRDLAGSIDGFLVHSDYYADFMADRLRIDPARFHRVPLGISPPGDLAASGAHEGDKSRLGSRGNRQPTIGYLARLAPEKGLHLLCDAIRELKLRPELRDVRLKIAGWSGPSQRSYIDQSLAWLRANYPRDVELVGEVTRDQKWEFLRTLDLLSVPSPYPDPKGIYLLEAIACGVPVVQPAHGAFPELLRSTGGGILFEPNNSQDLAHQLQTALLDHDLRARLGQEGRRSVSQHHSIEHAARQLWSVCQMYLQASPS